MNAKFFYLFIIVGILFIAVAIYNFLQGHVSGYTSIIIDLIIALLLFYRGYKVYMSKKDQELM